MTDRIGRIATSDAADDLAVEVLAASLNPTEQLKRVRAALAE